MNYLKPAKVLDATIRCLLGDIYYIDVVIEQEGVKATLEVEVIEAYKESYIELLCNYYKSLVGCPLYDLRLCDIIDSIVISKLSPLGKAAWLSYYYSPVDEDKDVVSVPLAHYAGGMSLLNHRNLEDLDYIFKADVITLRRSDGSAYIEGNPKLMLSDSGTVTLYGEFSKGDYVNLRLNDLEHFTYINPDITNLDTVPSLVNGLTLMVNNSKGKYCISDVSPNSNYSRHYNTNINDSHMPIDVETLKNIEPWQLQNGTSDLRVLSQTLCSSDSPMLYDNNGDEVLVKYKGKKYPLSFIINCNEVVKDINVSSSNILLLDELGKVILKYPTNGIEKVLKLEGLWRSLVKHQNLNVINFYNILCLNDNELGYTYLSRKTLAEVANGLKDNIVVRVKQFNYAQPHTHNSVNVDENIDLESFSNLPVYFNEGKSVFNKYNIDGFPKSHYKLDAFFAYENSSMFSVAVEINPTIAQGILLNTNSDNIEFYIAYLKNFSYNDQVECMTSALAINVSDISDDKPLIGIEDIGYIEVIDKEEILVLANNKLTIGKL